MTRTLLLIDLYDSPDFEGPDATATRLRRLATADDEQAAAQLLTALCAAQHLPAENIRVRPIEVPVPHPWASMMGEAA